MLEIEILALRGPLRDHCRMDEFTAHWVIRELRSAYGDRFGKQRCAALLQQLQNEYRPTSKDGSLSGALSCVQSFPQETLDASNVDLVGESDQLQI